MSLSRSDRTGKVKLVNKQIEWEITDSFTMDKEHFFYTSPNYSLADGTSLYLDLFPESTVYPGCIRLFVRPLEYADFFVECNFCYKKRNGHMTFLKGIKKNNPKRSKNSYLFEVPKIHEFKSDLSLFGDVVIITCIYKPETCQFDEFSIMNNSKNKKLTNLDTLSQNFRDLFLNEASCDTALFVKEKEYKAHKAILIARSSVFAAMFLHETTEKQTGIVTIADCDPVSFQQFLEFLYCGKIEELSFDSAISLYETSNKYNVQDLLTFCKEYMTENLTAENLCKIVALADKYDDAMLISATQNFFNENFYDVVQSSEWECLMKGDYRLVKELLKKCRK